MHIQGIIVLRCPLHNFNFQADPSLVETLLESIHRMVPSAFLFSSVTQWKE